MLSLPNVTQHTCVIYQSYISHWYVAGFAYKAIRTTGFLVISHMTCQCNLQKFLFVEISKTGNFVHHSYLCGLLNFVLGISPKGRPPSHLVKV